MPKTLAEIAIDAGLITKADAAKAGKMAEEQRQPLVVVLIRELAIDEVALVGAIRKQTRVPLIDPAEIQIDPEALRLVSRDVCARLRLLPLAITNEGATRVLRVAMANPTDTAAILEIESVTHAEVEICALPLSAIDELVDKGYRQINTAIQSRPLGPSGTPLAGPRRITSLTEVPDNETSVTAQIPLATLQALGNAHTVGEDLEARLGALVQLLVAKGVITEAELADALKKKPG